MFVFGKDLAGASDWGSGYAESVAASRTVGSAGADGGRSLFLGRRAIARRPTIVLGCHPGAAEPRPSLVRTSDGSHPISPSAVRDAQHGLSSSVAWGFTLGTSVSASVRRMTRRGALRVKRLSRAFVPAAACLAAHVVRQSPPSAPRLSHACRTASADWERGTTPMGPRRTGR